MRVSEIVGVLLRDGYNHALIESGLSKVHLAVFSRLVTEHRNGIIFMD